MMGESRGNDAHDTGQRNRRCAIIGGDGNMGRWFARFVAGHGYTVTVIEAGESFAAAASTDLVILATPLGCMRAVLQQVVDLAPSGLVLEIASLKSDLQDVVADGLARGLRLACLHPMFGPGAKDLAGRNVIVCRAGCEAAENEALALFAGTGAVVTELPLDEHDRAMTWVLNLPHLINLLMADVLQHSGRTLGELAPLGGTTYARQLAAAGEVMSENPELYYHIQHLNRHRDELHTALRASLDRLQDHSRDDSPAGFTAMMQAWRRFQEQTDD